MCSGIAVQAVKWIWFVSRL